MSNWITIICAECGEPKSLPPAQAKKRKYCGQDCGGIATTRLREQKRLQNLDAQLAIEDNPVLRGKAESLRRKLAKDFY